MLRWLRRSGLAVFMAVGTVLLSSPATRSLLSTGCRTASGAIVNKGWLDSSGVRHIRYKIPSNWSDAAKNRVSTAIDEWNARATVTHLVFDEDGDSDVEFVLTDPPSVCGFYNSDSDTIQLSQNLLAFASEYPNQVIHVIEHERGHVLGVAHEDSNSESIMYVQEGTNCGTEQGISSIPTGGIQNDDAVSADECIQALTDPEQEFPSEALDFVPGEDDCYQVWLVVTIYEWDPIFNYWEITSQQYYDVGPYCGDPGDYLNT